VGSEIILPICNAALFVIAYIFVKSFVEKRTETRASPLIRIAIVALGPIMWNAAILLFLFFVSIFLGPMMGNFAKFGSVIATLAHVLATIGEYSRNCRCSDIELG
jgi:1,3-beta-glucan synthase